MEAAAGLDGEPAELGPLSTPVSIRDRKTFCIAKPLPEFILHGGDPGFREEESRFYSSAESEAAEKLINLKAALRGAESDNFWTMATEGIVDLMGSQYAFLCKRVLVGDQDSTVEMPPVGEPSSCLMATSIYYDDGRGNKTNSEDVKYTTYGSPCVQMKHDKVFLVPERLSEVMCDYPQQLPEQPGAYLSVPLSAKEPGTLKEIVFGHFGVMWTAFGLEMRKLSYPFLEMCMHSLEDLMVTEFRDQALFSEVLNPAKHLNSVIPHEAITAAQSLKPYARSLSHELRTPMQGVVGMLDVMYAMVQEVSEGQNDPRLREVFAILKENVEIVQGENPLVPWPLHRLTFVSDSSRRAVEAADNVVQAYDMEMAVPDHPSSVIDEEDSSGSDYFGLVEYQLSDTPTTGGLASSPKPGSKRARSTVDEPPEVPGKFARRSSSDQVDGATSRRSSKDDHNSTVGDVVSTGTYHVSTEHHIAPGIRYTNIRDVIHFLTNDVLKVGGRPESVVAHQIDGGEVIEVRQMSSNGEEMEKVVEWMVDADVPETILVDERDLAGMISRIFHNAFKFTETGRITIAVRLSPKGKYILVNVKDTGSGIPSDFMPSLFKAFSKEDDGINRQSEGLGLGLMVAKGLARKLNGDLYAVRSETSGPNRGTEFEMRIPVTPGEIISRPGTPFSSRSPSVRSHSVDPDLMSVNGTATIAKSARLESAPSLHNKMVERRRYNRRNDSGTLTGRNSVVHKNPTQSESIICTEANTSQSHPQQISDSPSQRNPAHITSSTCSMRASSIPSVFSQLTPHVQFHRRRPCLRPDSPRRSFDAKLAQKLPLSFLVVEDNIINRKLLISMLRALGYVNVHEAYDGADSVRKMEAHRKKYLNREVTYEIDCVLMDLWMPTMNGYEAAEQILGMADGGPGVGIKGGPVSNSSYNGGWKLPVIMAVTADVTQEAMKSVARAGMKGPLTKPYKLVDLEKSIIAHCATGAMERMKELNSVAMMS